MIKGIGTAAKNLIENDFDCFKITITRTNHILRQQYEMIHLLIHLVKFISSFDLDHANVTKSGCNYFGSSRNGGAYVKFGS